MQQNFGSPALVPQKRGNQTAGSVRPTTSVSTRIVQSAGTALPQSSPTYTNYANYTTSRGPKYHPEATKQVPQFSYSISPLYNPTHVPTFEAPVQVRIDEARLSAVWKEQVEADRVYIEDDLTSSSSSDK